jgi:hypothetical protein
MSLILGSANRGRLWPSGPDQVKPRRDSAGRAWESRITRSNKALTMLVRIILACSAILLLARPAAAAEDCRMLDHEGRQALIRKAPTCDQAMEQFSDCNYGATGDTALAQIVIGKCEAAFLKKLNAKQRQAYAGEIKSCNDEVKEDEGTLSIAMGAGCRALAAQNYAHKFGKRH